MPTSPPQMIVESRDTDTFAARLQGLGWQHERTQLEVGASRATCRMIQTPHLLLARETHTRGLLASTVLPESCVAFGLLEEGQRPQRYAGRRLRESDVATATPDTCADLVTSGRWTFRYVTLDRAWLRRVCRSALNEDLDAVFPSTRALEMDRKFTRSLRRIVHRASSVLGAGASRAASAEIEEALALTALQVLVGSTRRQSLGTLTPPDRHRAVQAAQEYIEARLEGPLRLSELCRHVGVGVRALQIAFREQLGVTPYEYLLIRRLHRARQLLRKADPTEVTVAAVANQVGWFHLGRFSTRYKALFGEPASTTLRSS